MNNCHIAYGLIAASLAVTLLPAHRDFPESLDNHQRDVYFSLVRERRMIYVISVVTGVLASYMTMGGLHPKNTTRWCMGMGTGLGVTYLMYRLWPKSDYIVNHLREDQIPLWTEVYDAMTFRYHIGFVVGLVAFATLSA